MKGAARAGGVLLVALAACGGSGAAGGSDASAGAGGAGGAGGDLVGQGGDPGVCPPGATCADPTIVIEPPRSCSGVRLALASPWLYWTDQANETVYQMSTADHSSMALIGSQMLATFVVGFGDTVFWESLAGGIASYTTMPVAYRKVAGGANGPVQGLAISPDGAWLYFSSGNTIARAPTTGVAPTMSDIATVATTTVPAPGVGVAGVVATDGTWVVFTT